MKACRLKQSGGRTMQASKMQDAKDAELLAALNHAITEECLPTRLAARPPREMDGLNRARALRPFFWTQRTLRARCHIGC